MLIKTKDSLNRETFPISFHDNEKNLELILEEKNTFFADNFFLIQQNELVFLLKV